MKTKEQQKAKKWSMPRGRAKAIAVVTVVALLLAAGAIYYLVYVLKPAPKLVDSNNPFAQAVNKLLAGPVPDDPIQKAIFYAEVGQNYDNVGDHKNALKYYLMAQKVVDENKLQDQIVYYQAIADMYQTLDDKTSARFFLQDQLKYLQHYLSVHPDDAATQAAIKEVESRLGKL